MITGIYFSQVTIMHEEFETIFIIKSFPLFYL
jgi:hypothetical protein